MSENIKSLEDMAEAIKECLALIDDTRDLSAEQIRDMLETNEYMNLLKTLEDKINEYPEDTPAHFKLNNTVDAMKEYMGRELEMAYRATLEEERRTLKFYSLPDLFNLKLGEGTVEYHIDCDEQTMDRFIEHSELEMSAQEMRNNAVDAFVNVVIRDNGEMTVALQVEGKAYPVTLSDQEKQILRDQLETVFKEKGLPSIEESLEQARYSLNGKTETKVER